MEGGDFLHNASTTQLLMLCCAVTGNVCCMQLMLCAAVLFVHRCSGVIILSMLDADVHAMLSLDVSTSPPNGSQFRHHACTGIMISR